MTELWCLEYWTTAPDYDNPTPDYLFFDNEQAANITCAALADQAPDLAGYNNVYKVDVLSDASPVTVVYSITLSTNKNYALIYLEPSNRAGLLSPMRFIYTVAMPDHVTLPTEPVTRVEQGNGEFVRFEGLDRQAVILAATNEFNAILANYK